MYNITTSRLFHMITKSKCIDDVLELEEEEITNPEISEYLRELLEKKNKTISLLSAETLMDRSYVYQMFNGIRNPNRNALLRFSFAMGLSLEETQKLLRIARKGELYPRIRFDSAIIFAISKKYSLFDAHELLEQIGEATLLNGNEK